jgi:hypothetical protein
VVFGSFLRFPHRYGDSHPSIHHYILTLDRIFVLALRIRMQSDFFLKDMVFGCVLCLCNEISWRFKCCKLVCLMLLRVEDIQWLCP